MWIVRSLGILIWPWKYSIFESRTYASKWKVWCVLPERNLTYSAADTWALEVWIAHVCLEYIAVALVLEVWSLNFVRRQCWEKEQPSLCNLWSASEMFRQLTCKKGFVNSIFCRDSYCQSGQKSSKRTEPGTCWTAVYFNVLFEGWCMYEW